MQSFFSRWVLRTRESTGPRLLVVVVVVVAAVAGEERNHGHAEARAQMSVGMAVDAEKVTHLTAMVQRSVLECVDRQLSVLFTYIQVLAAPGGGGLGAQLATMCTNRIATSSLRSWRLRSWHTRAVMTASSRYPQERSCSRRSMSSTSQLCGS